MPYKVFFSPLILSRVSVHNFPNNLQEVSLGMQSVCVCVCVCSLSRKYPVMYYEKQRHLLKKIQDIRNIVHRTMMPLSPSRQAPWDLTQFSQSPSAALSYFPESHQQSKISSLSKVILVLGKTRSLRVLQEGLNHLGDLTLCQKTTRDVMQEWAHCHEEAANHQLPIAAAF